MTSYAQFEHLHLDHKRTNGSLWRQKQIQLYKVTDNIQTDLSALVFSPIYGIPGPSTFVHVCVFKRKCIGAGSSGCMFVQAVSDSHSDDVAEGTMPATHTHVHTHM